MRKFLNFTPFSELSRHKQRDEFIKLRWKIKNKKHGENFYGWSPLMEPGRPGFFNQEVQIYFLGLDGHTIWNAFVCTAMYAYWGNISELASNKAWELAPEKNTRLRDDFIPQYDGSGRLKHYILKEEQPHPALGNKTKGDFMREYESELIKSDTGNTAPVFEEFRIEPGFEYGTGLYATIDVPEITVDALEGMIAKFRALGEKPWKSEAPVPREKLPRDTFQSLAKAISSNSNVLGDGHEKSKAAKELVRFMDAVPPVGETAPELTLEQANTLVHELRP